jgi:ferredoxin-NADP reductase/predicted pyridoxine 5'-phosphate oxidase superfamily flavin-nucleotide-binding protein
MRIESTSVTPFHTGEQQVQDRLGVREAIEPWASKVVRTHLPDEHRLFYEELPFLVAAARDASGRPWATLLAGRPGFVHSPDSETLLVESQPGAGDALAGMLTPGADLGLLGIELATRRRNRVNGRVRDAGGSGESNASGEVAIAFSVDQSFGNCPQYISPRTWRWVEPKKERPPGQRTIELTDRMADWIASADTFFIASGHRETGEDVRFGMDASHRGGAPGFVEVKDARTLLIPDYAGNNHFNTLGNLIVDPRAGLLFVDFETGDMLQLTGRAEIDWESDQVGGFPGARRLIHFSLEEAVLLEDALPLRWEDAIDAARNLRVVEKTRESAEVMSFLFEADDGRPLSDFAAGQYLPINLRVGERDETLTRTYSLSNSPGQDRYRISVKRESQGRASRYLHEAVDVGTLISTGAPTGEFVLAHDTRPTILVSAGIGVTPMLSMLHTLTESATRAPVWFVHGARDGDHHAFAREVQALARKSASVRTHVSYSRPLSTDREGEHFDTKGRVSGALLASLLPDLEASFYLCGPIAFMAEIQSELEALGVPSDQIYSESFGPT